MSRDGIGRPRVLVTGPHRKLRYAWWATHLQLLMAGLNASYRTAETPDIPSGIQGVVIGGGNDIEPEHYGLPSAAGRSYDPERDAFEMRVLRFALDSNIPILGICRGAQLINVVEGGSLYEDIRPWRKRTPNRFTALPVKRAYFEPGTTLRTELQRSSTRINSLHNQAMDKIAEPLRVAAHDADDFVQAIEMPDREFVLGVQWHPEYMPYDATQRKLFQLFAAAVKACDNELECRDGADLKVPQL